jgi:predicted O-methyltransferase YrrM
VIELVSSLVRATQPGIVVETGTALGETAKRIGEALASNGHGHLWTVEIDAAAARTAAAVTAGLPVTICCSDSLEWEPPDSIDFAWIDSGAASVRVEEIRRWQRKFRPGALVAVHDTAPNSGREALRDSLESLLEELGWQALALRTPRGVTIAQVP